MRVEIAKIERYSSKSHPLGTYSVIATLKCGHAKRYKGSQWDRLKTMKVRCEECSR